MLMCFLLLKDTVQEMSDKYPLSFLILDDIPIRGNLRNLMR